MSQGVIVENPIFEAFELHSESKIITEFGVTSRDTLMDHIASAAADYDVVVEGE